MRVVSPTAAAVVTSMPILRRFLQDREQNRSTKRAALDPSSVVFVVRKKLREPRQSPIPAR